MPVRLRQYRKDYIIQTEKWTCEKLRLWALLAGSFFVQISVIFSSGCPEKVRRNHLQTIKEDWKMTDKEKQQIKALRESGESYAQISKMMDLPINSIKTYCRRNNLTSIDVEKEDKTSTCLECGNHQLRGFWQGYRSDEAAKIRERHRWWKWKVPEALLLFREACLWQMWRNLQAPYTLSAKRQLHRMVLRDTSG